jgi:hypothetical protein
MRSAGIRGLYESRFQPLTELKEGVLFEVGFDKTTPFEHKDLSSWAYDKAKEVGIAIIDNRAKNVKCYLPEYTFIEKLQTISTKYRKNISEKNDSPVNFIRHYYDVFMLLNTERVIQFIGSPSYLHYKNKKFGQADELDIGKNPAFLLSDASELERFSLLYEKKSEIYFSKAPSFQEIINKIMGYSHLL